jgi:hypothetical protein
MFSVPAQQNRASLLMQPFGCLLVKNGDRCWTHTEGFKCKLEPPLHYATLQWRLQATVALCMLAANRALYLLSSCPHASIP